MPAVSSEAVQTIGRRVRARRNELGLTLEQAAPLCQVHWSALGHLERGERNPSVLTLLRIAQGLDVDPGVLVTGISVD